MCLVTGKLRMELQQVNLSQTAPLALESSPFQGMRLLLSCSLEHSYLV